MTDEKDIWTEKPDPGDHKYWSDVLFESEFYHIQFLIDDKLWLDKLNAKITQLNECLGEYESKEWCDHCIIDSKCAQITLYVQELKKKAEPLDGG